MTEHDTATLWEKIGKLEAATAVNAKLIWFISALMVAGVGADIAFHSNVKEDVTLVGSIFVAFVAGTGVTWFIGRKKDGRGK